MVSVSVAVSVATTVPIAEASSTFAVVVTVPPSVIVKLLVPTLVKECIVYPPL